MDLQGYLEALRLLPSGGALKPAEAVPSQFIKDAQQASIAIVLATLGCLYSVQNLIAPNMTAIANLFHFNAYERDAYVGGELTLFFYLPGVFGALLAGLLSGVMERRLLLAGLAALTGVACLCTSRVGTFHQLLVARAISGFAIGGSLPVVYSLVGDWYPARRRASATAFVTAASGAGVFGGQCLSTVVGPSDWRVPFFIIALPCLGAALAMWYMMEEPSRGCQEDGVETLSLYQSAGMHYSPVFGTRHLRALMQNRTNVLVILQAFPGNIPWGVIIVYTHDFLVQDLGLSTSGALGAITILAGAAFAGILTGGFIGEYLYKTNGRYLALFGGVCNILRAVPFFMLFGWQKWFGSWAHSSEFTFFVLLFVGGFIATMASPCTGAMLLNVNLPETRGYIMAMYSVLDDLSKGFGTLFVAMIVPWVGGRAVAYQISLLVWVFTGIVLLFAYYTYDQDEEMMRKHLEETAMESMVVLSKQRAQQAIRHCARAAGEAHFARRNGAAAGLGLDGAASEAGSAAGDAGRGAAGAAAAGSRPAPRSGMYGSFQEGHWQRAVPGQWPAARSQMAEAAAALAERGDCALAGVSAQRAQAPVASSNSTVFQVRPDRERLRRAARAAAEAADVAKHSKAGRPAV